MRLYPIKRLAPRTPVSAAVVTSSSPNQEFPRHECGTAVNQVARFCHMPFVPHTDSTVVPCGKRLKQRDGLQVSAATRREHKAVHDGPTHIHIVDSGRGWCADVGS